MKRATTVYKVVVAFFFEYLKSRLLAFAGGYPHCTPHRSEGAGLSARRLCKICRGSSNTLSLVRSRSFQTGKCILYAEKSMPGRKKPAEELFFPLKRTVFPSYGQKNICPFVGKKIRLQAFSCLA